MIRVKYPIIPNLLKYTVGLPLIIIMAAYYSVRWLFCDVTNNWDLDYYSSCIVETIKPYWISK